MDSRDKYTEKVARRMYLGSNIGMGCGLTAIAFIILIVLMIICGHFK